jgi:hypothetical protein
MGSHAIAAEVEHRQRFRVTHKDCVCLVSGKALAGDMEGMAAAGDGASISSVVEAADCAAMDR